MTITVEECTRIELSQWLALLHKLLVILENVREKKSLTRSEKQSIATMRVHFATVKRLCVSRRRVCAIENFRTCVTEKEYGEILHRAFFKNDLSREHKAHIVVVVRNRMRWLARILAYGRIGEQKRRRLEETFRILFDTAAPQYRDER